MSVHRLRHEAMATTFEVAVEGPDPAYLRQAAAAAFRELERLETELSRFVESGDIGRVNRLRRGESAAISDDALRCLMSAAELAEATRGAFDPAYLSERDGGEPADQPAFTLDPDAHVLTSRVAALRIDLGAIGKGYALDRMAEVLEEWGVVQACLSSGGSTVLALDGPGGKPGWPVTLGGDGAPLEIHLRRRALSGSGTAVKGRHLVDPRTRAPAARTTRTWALAPSAAVSDALSTAFFVMTDAEVGAFCRAHGGIGAAAEGPDGSLRLIADLGA